MRVQASLFDCAPQATGEAMPLVADWPDDHTGLLLFESGHGATYRLLRGQPWPRCYHFPVLGSEPRSFEDVEAALGRDTVATSVALRSEKRTVTPPGAYHTHALYRDDDGGVRLPPRDYIVAVSNNIYWKQGIQDVPDRDAFEDIVSRVRAYAAEERT